MTGNAGELYCHNPAVCHPRRPSGDTFTFSVVCCDKICTRMSNYFGVPPPPFCFADSGVHHLDSSITKAKYPCCLVKLLSG